MAGKQKRNNIDTIISKYFRKKNTIAHIQQAIPATDPVLWQITKEVMKGYSEEDIKTAYHVAYNRILHVDLNDRKGFQLIS